jgi:hypothetical protein
MDTEVDDGAVEDQDVDGADGATDQDVTEEPKAPPAVQKYKFKAAGKDREMTLDELLKHASKGIGAEEKFGQAAKLAKAAAALEMKIKSDPFGALVEALGSREAAHKFMEDNLYDEYKTKTLSPEQKAAAEAKRAADERENNLKKREQEIEQRELSRKAEEFGRKFDTEATEAMRKIGLEQTEESVYEFARLARIAIDEDMELDLEDIAQRVKEDFSGRTSKHIGQLSAQQLMELIPEDRMNEISKLRLSKIRPRTGQGKPIAGIKQESQVQKKTKLPLNGMEWEEYWDEYKSKLKD